MENSDFLENSSERDQIDVILESVAKDLNLHSREYLDVKLQLFKHYIRNLQALKESIYNGALPLIVHPFIAERLAEKALGLEESGVINFDENSGIQLAEEPLYKIGNPAKFKNPAIFVHRIAPIPGTTRGKIVCTWAFDVTEDTKVIEILEKTASYIQYDISLMRLVFCGANLRKTSTLLENDIRAGDTLYLYTLRDPGCQQGPSWSCYAGPSFGVQMCQSPYTGPPSYGPRRGGWPQHQHVASSMLVGVPEFYGQYPSAAYNIVPPYSNGVYTPRIPAFGSEW